MPRFEFAFLVRDARDLDPPLRLGGLTLAKLDPTSQGAVEALSEELGSLDPSELEVDGSMRAVVVEVQAADEGEALTAAYHQATLNLAPYSLVVPEREGIDLSRRSPVVLPNALAISHDTDPPSVDFRYEEGPHLARINVGDGSVAHVRDFNHRVVRRIARLYPSSILRAGEERCSLALRVARAVHWFSQAESQGESTMAFVCYWIGLEALALKSSTSTGKKRALVGRVSRLATRSGGHDTSDALAELWNKRSDIVHEGFGVAPDGIVPEITADDINAVRYFFFLALVYALDQHDAGVALEELWHPRNADTYSPSVPIGADEFPSLWQVVGLQRGYAEPSREGPQGPATRQDQPSPSRGPSEHP